MGRRVVPFVMMVSLIGATPALAAELKNEDSQSYDYELACGGMTSQSMINGNSSSSLSSSSTSTDPCDLKIKGGAGVKFSGGNCRISGGSVFCEEGTRPQPTEVPRTREPASAPPTKFLAFPKASSTPEAKSSPALTGESTTTPKTKSKPGAKKLKTVKKKKKGPKPHATPTPHS